MLTIHVSFHGTVKIQLQLRNRIQYKQYKQSHEKKLIIIWHKNGIIDNKISQRHILPIKPHQQNQRLQFPDL